MRDFKAKMHQIRFRLGSLQRSPDPLAGFGATSRQGRGAGLGKRREGESKGREGKWKGREREGPKLLLNQGPSEPCYATVIYPEFFRAPCRKNSALDRKMIEHLLEWFRRPVPPCKGRGDRATPAGCRYENMVFVCLIPFLSVTLCLPAHCSFEGT